MLNVLIQIGNGILPIVVTAVVAILGTIITIVGKDFVGFIQAKHDEAVAKAGASTYNQNRKFALDIWNIVDEHFRVSGTVKAAITDKIDLFNKLLLEKIPGLTQSEIDFLRQSIAGEINKGRDVILQPAIEEKVTSIDAAKEPDKAEETSKSDSNVNVSTEKAEASTIAQTHEVKEAVENLASATTQSVKSDAVANNENTTVPVTANTEINNTVTASVDVAATVSAIQDLLSKLQIPTA